MADRTEKSPHSIMLRLLKAMFHIEARLMRPDDTKWTELDLMITAGRFASREDAVNQALTAMTWMIKHCKQGREIVACNSGDTKSFILSMPFLTGLSEQ